MHPWVIIDLRFCSTSAEWQPAVPHETWAIRRSPGLTNRMNSGDSWLSSVYDRCGLAAPGQNCGYRGLTWALALSLVSAQPPWQSVQPRRTVSLKCGSWAPWWQVRQPALLAAASSADWPSRLTPTISGG